MLLNSVSLFFAKCHKVENTNFFSSYYVKNFEAIKLHAQDLNKMQPNASSIQTYIWGFQWTTKTNKTEWVVKYRSFPVWWWYYGPWGGFWLCQWIKIYWYFKKIVRYVPSTKHRFLHFNADANFVSGGPKVSFPLRTLNKLKNFAEFPEALIADFVFLIEDKHNLSMLTSFLTFF